MLEGLATDDKRQAEYNKRASQKLRDDIHLKMIWYELVKRDLVALYVDPFGAPKDRELIKLAIKPLYDLIGDIEYMQSVLRDLK